MLFVLGLGSNVGLSVTLTSVIRDRFTRITHLQAILGVAIFQFSFGLLYVTSVSFNLLSDVNNLLKLIQKLYRVDSIC